MTFFWLPPDITWLQCFFLDNNHDNDSLIVMLDVDLLMHGNSFEFYILFNINL